MVLFRDETERNTAFIKAGIYLHDKKRPDPEKTYEVSDSGLRDLEFDRAG